MLCLEIKCEEKDKIISLLQNEIIKINQKIYSYIKYQLLQQKTQKWIIIIIKI